VNDTVIYDYPDAAELREIEPELLPMAEEEDPIFKEFPIEESEYDRLIWVQKDNYFGLQQVRGLEGEPRAVKRVGSKQYDMEPGEYGEYTTIDSKELQQRRKLATWNEPINIDELVGDAQMLLLRRRIDRIRYIIWTLLTTGQFAIPQADGTILHADRFPLRTATSAVAWTTYATATPFADFQAVQLLALGQSVDFGAGATMWMNRVTANALLRNANPADIFGRFLSRSLRTDASGAARRLEALPVPAWQRSVFSAFARFFARPSDSTYDLENSPRDHRG